MRSQLACLKIRWVVKVKIIKLWWQSCADNDKSNQKEKQYEWNEDGPRSNIVGVQLQLSLQEMSTIFLCCTVQHVQYRAV